MKTVATVLVCVILAILIYMKNTCVVQPIEILSAGRNEHELFVRATFKYALLVENSYQFDPGTKIYGMSVLQFENTNWSMDCYYTADK